MGKSIVFIPNNISICFFLCVLAAGGSKSGLKISKPLVDQRAKEGENVTFKCTAAGTGKSVSWWVMLKVRLYQL